MHKTLQSGVLAGALATTLMQGSALAGTSMSERLDAVIDRWVSQEKIVGVVAMIAKDGEIVYRRAAGWADRENAIPVREDTIFRHASNTKAIVSVAALKLIEEGKLSLDDKVTKWLPYFTPRLDNGRRPEISIRQLMTHTSGLSYSFFEPEGNAYIAGGVPQGIEAGPATLEEALRKLAAAPLFYEPGTEWRYSLSTDVLGAVVEKAAGMRLEDAVKQYVTGPLAMTSTTFHVTDAKRLAAAYRDGESRAIRMNDRLDYLPLGTGGPVSPARALDPDAYPSGGGGMSGTADEYIRFLEVLRTGGGPLLSTESVTALTSHQIGDLRAWTEGEGWGFGLGVAVLLDPEAAQTPQGNGTWQWGGALGSHWFVDPSNKLTVVVLTNTAVAGVIGSFPAEIREAVYGVDTGDES